MSTFGRIGVLVEVVLDEIGHVRVDQLVVRDAVAHRVGDGDVSEAGGEHEARRAQHRVGAELQRIEELVVDTAVDDVDPRRACGRAHPDPTAGAEQVAALDQLHAHQSREQGVLEVGGVVDARGEHDDVGLFDADRRARPQRLEQPVRIVAHRTHAHGDEELRKRLRHDAAIRDDVADTAGHADVVLEHPPGPRLVADQVDAGDMDAHAVGGGDARGLTVVVGGRGDERCGDDPVEDGTLRAVDIGEERLERSHPLLDAGLDIDPLLVVDHPRHRIEREGPLLPREVEGHALCEIARCERVGATPQLGLGHLGEGAVDLAVRLASTDRSAHAGRHVEHLVPRRMLRFVRARRLEAGVAVEQVSHDVSLLSRVAGRFQRPALRVRACEKRTGPGYFAGPCVFGMPSTRE